MDHRLQDRRSLDIHRFLGNRLLKNPEMLSKLKALFEHWDSLPHGCRMKSDYREVWLKAIAAGVDAVYSLVTEESDQGQVLRSCSPFGVLWSSPSERLTFMLDWVKNNTDIQIPSIK
jgi:hypothetical protein